MATDKPLRLVADAFKELAAIVSSPNPKVSIKQYSDACSLFTNLFGILETAFRFAKIDYLAKVNDLAKASSSISTLQLMVDIDINSGCEMKKDSHTRCLLWTKRVLEMVRVLFEEIIATNADSSLKDAAFKAYNQVFANYHGQVLQASAATAMDSLASRSTLLLMINETEETAKIYMQSYVTASKPVTKYVDDLFLSKNLGIDW
ncbi:hypothetical protein CARUB_v10027661mg [Capsella rubella]|uniref:Glycolipid transfer protein domain-containing protein n=1 Tax=Capsella rubella TaxID=81985 RepID=R0GK22_9BRAS|nr:accelerated cell death 11 [Capsella rubella]EOA12645.1 hypothetical protein CARUB_v10027661mg [Capsella rubella]